MPSDLLKQFVSVRESLVQERDTILERLTEINRVLSSSSTPPLPPDRSKPASRPGYQRKNAMSMREAVVQVLSRGPMSRKDIVAAVKGLGYKFRSKKPDNSLGVLLYLDKKTFRNEAGRFRLIAR